MNSLPVIPTLSIDMKKNRIRIHRNTLHLLGSPKYIQLLVNPTKELIVVMPGRKDDPLAHPVKEHQITDNNCFELSSKKLINSLRQVNGMFKEQNLYKLCGHYFEKQNVAQFYMHDIERGS